MGSVHVRNVSQKLINRRAKNIAPRVRTDKIIKKLECQSLKNCCITKYKGLNVIVKERMDFSTLNLISDTQ
jgi:hypothetical protein